MINSILRTISNESPYSYQEIKNAYGLLSSIDKLLICIHDSLEHAIGFEMSVDKMYKKFKGEKEKYQG